MHEQNCFITLTYDDQNLPWDGSLNPKHFQDFMKRLRFKYRPQNIRFFHCGEYGEQYQRPHYHALLFNHDFEDKQLWTERDGIPTYISEELENLWPFGFSTVGRITWESAAYCARYVTKKFTGKDAQEKYWRILATDIEVQLQPEYATMSLKPGIGQTWFTDFKDDCYPSDFITVRGKKKTLPRYYDKLYHDLEPEQLERLKKRRREKAWERASDLTPSRLAAREQCAHAKLHRLNRPIEEKR